MALEHIQPDGLFPSERLGFTQVVTAAAARTIYVSGQVGCDAVGRPVSDDLAAQATQALANLGEALAAADASPSDVAMIRVYIVDYEPSKAAIVGRAVGAFFEGVEKPASTWVGVAALFAEAFQIEIEAIAVLS